MKKTEVERCPLCAAKMVKYRHRMNMPLAITLFRFYEKDKPYHYEKLGLNHKQQANLCKLQYWDLLEKVVDEDGKRKNGSWQITDTGRLWIRGKISIPAWAVTYRNKIDHLEGDLIPFRTFHPYEWRERPDYVRDQEPIRRNGQRELF